MVETTRLIGPQSSILLIAQNDPSRSSVPPVQGNTESRARERLKERGFNKVTAYVTSEKVKCPPDRDGYVPGIVCETNPSFKSGSGISVDTEIALLVQGERTDDEEYGFPPKIIGMSRVDAVKTLADKRWDVSILRYMFVEDTACSPGIACGLGGRGGAKQNTDGSWDINGNTDAPRRTFPYFTLYIGSKYPRGGKDTDTIDLTGESFDDALDKLDRLGVRGPIEVEHRYGCQTEEVPAGRVCGQSLQKGGRTSSKGLVYFMISKGRGPLPTRSADDSPFPAKTENGKKP